MYKKKITKKKEDKIKFPLGWCIELTAQFKLLTFLTSFGWVALNR